MTQSNICFDAVIPILRVEDFGDSIDYYVNKLGFEKEWDFGNPPDFGCIRRGESQVFICQGALGQPGMWLAFPVSDVDALHEGYKKSDAIIVEPPADQFYGMRVMVIGDLDGHRLRMASSLEESVDQPNFHRAE